MKRAFIFLFAAGCVGHISPYTPRHRDFDAGEYGAAPTAGRNSLFTSGQRSVFDDDRAAHVGDVVIIQVDEQTTAQHDGATALDKKANLSMGLSGGLVDALQKVMPSVALAQLLGANSASGFAGSGSIQKHGMMNATLPVRVRKVLPNRDLYVEGTKVVMVGEEEHHLYISGIVRPTDIRSDGTVSSSTVSDAEIEYTGRGDISDTQRRGWLARAMSKLWPF